MEVQPKNPTAKGPAEWFTGDVIRVAPDEEHWHGATPDNFMTHLALTEGDTQWGDHLTDAEYPPE